MRSDKHKEPEVKPEAVIPVKIEEPEIKISDKPRITPAKEKAPDQEVLKKPIPKMGMNLLASWKSPK